MIIANYIDAHGAEQCRLFLNFEGLHKETFSPDCQILDTVELKTRGTTYQERKEHWIKLADRVKKMNTGSLTYNEIQILRNCFQMHGEKTGNINLFQEMGIL